MRSSSNPQEQVAIPTLPGLPHKLMTPSQLSRELRHGTGGFLDNRRGIAALSLTAIGCMGLIVLYQMGIIKHLPEPALPGLDAEKVDASDEAYSCFETPDAAIGLGSTPRPPSAQLSLSIIVPVLNEADGIVALLRQLRRCAPDAQIIVADGGSSDGTAELARPHCDILISPGRGRARQMNAGASYARGEVLWFVHADSNVPEGCVDEMARALADSRTVGGCFRIRFPRPELIYRLSDSVGNIGVDVLRRSYGDHGIFCRRDDFVAIGGFPNVPIMEDAELYRKLGRRGRMRQVRSAIITSPRRFERIGPYRLTAAFVLISTLWILHVPMPLIARIYKRLCTCADEPCRSTT